MVARDGLIEELARRLDDSEADAYGVASEARDIATRIVTATRLGDNLWGNVHCRNCNSYIGMMVGGNQCPRCGTPIS
jgi:hypothetical protein